ncbi:TPA: hypothetical protein HA231_04085 [Candidatus Woesearchaeota archaeon]|nr:hypothetical protein [Candidatus Woesearchaeota archaeon]
MEALAYLAATFAGILAGIFTGLLPGLHVNAAAVLVASLFYGRDGGLVLAALIIAMSISHVFHEFLPSVFLGFSESEAALAVLPGHRMLLNGQGRKAVMMSAFGGIIGVLGVALLAPALVILLRPAFFATKGYVAPILAGVIAFHFYRSRKQERVPADLLVLLLSGAFGIAVFSLPTIREPLLPMLSGLFGVSSLAWGLFKKPSIPSQQQQAAIEIKKPARIARLFTAGVFSSSLMSLFPSLGPAQAAMLGTTTAGKLKAESYLFLLGIISSASMLLGLLSLYSFEKARNGSIAVIGNIMQINPSALAILLAVSAIAASLSFASAMLISSPFSALIKTLDYSLISKAVIALIALLVILLSGFPGLIVLAVATAIGLIPVMAKSSRQMLMGCLMIPVLLHYI